MKSKCISIAILILLMVFFSVAGCGSSGGGDSDSSAAEESDDGLTASEISLLADPTSIVADGTSTSMITATVKTATGQGVPDIEVSFGTDNGSITASGNTNAEGKATATLTSSTEQAVVANVTASVGSISGTTTVSFSDSGASKISVLADPTSIVANGTSTSTITATVKTATGQGVPGIKVEFGTNNGSITASEITNGEGKASTTLTSSAGQGVVATVTASVGSISDTTTVTFSDSGAFKISVLADPTSIVANGTSTSTITATVKTATGQGVPDIKVSFGTDNGSITASGNTNAEGKATAALTSSTQQGVATVTASVGSISGTTTVTFSDSGASTISVSADPTSIVADGTSTSTITATVKTATGQGVPGIRVEFGTNNGSITASEITNAEGKATATLTSSAGQGVVATVTASVESISGTTTVTFSDSGASTISVSADPTSIVANGTSTSTITAIVKTATGQGVPGIKVELGTDNGSITASGITDAEGKATATLTSSTQQGVANVTALIGSISGITTVTFSGGGVTASSIKLSADPISVKSDNSDSSIITANVLDASNAVIEGITVVFSAGGGQISASSADTDANGKAQITFSSGTLDPSNQVVTITGTVSGLSSQVPVQITGSTLTLSTDNSNITDDGSTTAILTITAKDAGGKPVYNIPITLTVSETDGAAILSEYTGNTDSSGKLQVTVTGTDAGSVTVTAEGLRTTGTQAYTVSSVGALFGIISPTTDPYLLFTNDPPLTITVNAPGLTKVQFATTLGTLTGTIDGKTGQVIEESVDSVSETASAVFSSSQAGLATIQVFDPLNSSTSDTLGIAITAPFGDAAHITLQSSTYVLAPSSGGISNTATLTATVRTSDLQVVGGAPVAFSIENPTGGGETVSPVVVYTNESGVATTIFTSGSLPSVEPVIVNARVVGMAVAVALDPGITIGGTAGSVVIGMGTKITVLNETTYAMPMSVLVADSNGNSVPGAVVSLSAWPAQYSAGTWYDENPGPAAENFVPYISGTFDNEDLNENTFLDPGEDKSADGLLTPHNSAAGTLPTTVTTDENGVANFDLIYLKAHANWIVDRIRASTFVLGTETTASTTFCLPYARSEGDAGDLNDSPYPVGLTVGSGTTVTYIFPVFTRFDTFSTYLSSDSSITINGEYTYTEPGTGSVGDVIMDYVTIIGTVFDPITGAASYISTIVPVQIIIQ